MSRKSFLERVYAASTAGESRDLYDAWAPSYDSDLAERDYALPKLVARALLDTLGDSGAANTTLSGLRILDAGCGTGLVGKELSYFGANKILGMDISPGMLEVAQKTGFYESVQEADLTQPISKPDGAFEAVVCVGTLTQGHVGPRPVLREFVRVLKMHGIIVATVLESVWETGGFKAEIDKLQLAAIIEVRRSDEIGITAGSNTGGRLLVLRKL